jgi:hypothetical protein
VKAVVRVGEAVIAGLSVLLLVVARVLPLLLALLILALGMVYLRGALRLAPVFLFYSALGALAVRHVVKVRRAREEWSIRLLWCVLSTIPLTLAVMTGSDMAVFLLGTAGPDAIHVEPWRVEQFERFVTAGQLQFFQGVSNVLLICLLASFAASLAAAIVAVIAGRLRPPDAKS